MANKKTKESSAGVDSCCKKMEVPSEEEVLALNAMRGIKERVRDMKMRLSQISSSNKGEDKAEALDLEKKMQALKEKWNAWEEKRKKAAKERMILLGHEE